MAELGLKAERRDGRGKGVARRLRAAGKVPGVVYGRGIDVTPVAVGARDLGHLLGREGGTSVLITLDIDGATHLTIPRSVERHPVKGTLVHIDFLAVERDQRVTVDTAVHLDGDAPGVREGGVLEHHLWALHVECVPHDVPERINVDVSNLAVGESIHVSDVTPPPGVTILTPAEEIIVSCVLPQAPKLEPELAETPVEGEAAATGRTTAEGEGGAG